MKWFKFYGQDFQTDPKMGFLNPLQKLMWVNLLCIASQDEEHSGVVKFVTESQLASLCGVTDNQFNDDWERTRGTLDLFEEMGLIERPDDKTIVIIKFKERQDTNLSDAERAKKYRSKAKKEVYCDDSVTNVTEVSQNRHTRLDKIRLDKNREEKREKDPSASLSYLDSIPDQDMQEFIGRFDVTPKEVTRLAETLKNYCLSKGKIYKNYKAFLLNAMKRDFKEKADIIRPKPVEEIKITPEQAAANQAKIAEMRKMIFKKL